MPVINGRLVCCSCGNDLGDADDPYRDPACGVCLERDNEADAEHDRGLSRDADSDGFDYRTIGQWQN